ncbi:MAG TPA: hypothetical protein DGG94_17305 [Micromonosporaceae bacterium]|nr:hypothetical protein [Micromonosporaceae bacterium]
MTSPHGYEVQDPRVTFGLISDLFALLREHGYKPPSSSAERYASFGRMLGYLVQLTAAYEGQAVTDGGPGRVAPESDTALLDMAPEVAEVHDLVSRMNRATVNRR